MDDRLKQYIEDHFMEALRNDIKVYYQPVIRTLSRKLCSFEALSRWIVPEYGFINPDVFIPVLEENNYIHLLDSHVIQQVCARIRMILDEGETPVPVSINLSRHDFALCDIYSVVAEAAATYQIPHELLFIEITESVIGDRPDEMREVINKFRKSGFQVWMDDFGSGYSTLNVLKDFDFDEIKLDMNFLSSFSLRARRIIASLIQMAKEIQIHTLAEGVETEEQDRFLRNIGCEKVQGFFYSRPLPYDQVMRRLDELGIVSETAAERHYYDEIGRINLLSSVPFMTREEKDRLTTARQLNSIPLCLLSLERDCFRILFYNSALEDTAAALDIGSVIFTQENLRTDQPYSMISSRLRELLNTTARDGEGRMLFVSNEEYYEIRTRRVAHTRGADCVLASVTNLSRASDSSRTNYLDEGLREVYTLFERITIFDTVTDTITPIYMGVHEDLLSGRSDIAALGREFADKMIFPDDRKRCIDFSDMSTIEERIAADGRNYVTAFLRTRKGNGYVWKQYILLRFRHGAYLHMIRNAHKDVIEYRETILSKLENTGKRDTFSAEVLWDNLMRSGVDKIFWKDLDRRFVGVSQGFLDYYGFDSQDAVIGKTDEELGWHIRPDQYMDDELRIIHDGISTRNIPGRCISKGENRDILASKAPIYDDNGEICGLIGHFVDREYLNINDSRGAEAQRRDLMTGLLSSRAIEEEADSYRDEYYLRGMDFVRLHIAIDDFNSVNHTYGYDFGDKVLTALGKELKAEFGLSSAVSRYNGNMFVILHQIHDAEDMNVLNGIVGRIADNLREVNGVPLTLYLSQGYSIYSETESLTEQSRRADLMLLADHKDHKNRLYNAVRDNYKSADLTETHMKLARKSEDAARIAELQKSVTSLLTNMPGLTFSKDAATGIYLACNQAFAEYAHKDKPEGVVGLTDHQIFDKETADHFVLDDKIALSMDEPYIFFEDVRDAAGNSKQFQTTKIKFTDDSGRLCTLGMCVDVTEMVKAQKESRAFSNIAGALAEDYFNICYVDLETGEYIEYGTHDDSGDTVKESRGRNFFSDSTRNAVDVIYEEDLPAFIAAFTREKILDAIDREGKFTMIYRITSNGEPKYVSLKATHMENDDTHIIVGVSNIDTQIRQQEALERVREEKITYSRITALSDDFVAVYTIDPLTGEYTEYSSGDTAGGAVLPEEGSDFFAEARRSCEENVYADDREALLHVLDREFIISEIKEKGAFSFEYRRIVDGMPVYVALRAALVDEKGGPQIIIGISNIDARVKREQDYIYKLTLARNKANLDALTGVKNKHAYIDLEAEINRQIEDKHPIEFAVVVFDVNGLKEVNDNYGHQAGDRFIRDACTIICDIFKRSPVFRVGGDEFAVIVQGADYEHLDELIKAVRETNLANKASGNIVVACGVSRYEGDRNVAAVFERADAGMYADKRRLKL